MTALYIVYAIIGLGILILFHEFGHFITAKLLGIKVEIFSLGLGPLILKKRYGETDYGISSIPFGGYVKLLGMEVFEEVAYEDEGRTYRAQPVWKRIIVIFSGAFFNLILPIFLILFSLIYFGQPVASKTVDLVLKDTPAAQAGIKKGDTIKSVDGKTFKEWKDIRSYLRSNPGKPISVTVNRGSSSLQINTKLGNRKGVGFLGVQPGVEREHLPLPRAISESVKVDIGLIKLTGVGFYMLFTGQLGSISNSVGGPIRIVEETSKAASNGLEQFLFLIAALSINLGIINLVPLLPLDGGHLLFNIIEGVIRRPVKAEVRQVLSVIGIALLVLVMVAVTFLDINRFIGR